MPPSNSQLIIDSLDLCMADTENAMQFFKCHSG